MRIQHAYIYTIRAPLHAAPSVRHPQFGVLQSPHAHTINSDSSIFPPPPIARKICSEELKCARRSAGVYRSAE
ncbi:hypothetical protein VTO73DRAFT_12929 [Trametes versicolor]